MGIRPAIREMGYEGTSTAEAIRKRAHREGWMANVPRNVPLPPTMSPKPPSIVPNVTFDPATALINAFKEDMVQTRLGASRLVRRQVKHLEEKPDNELVADGGGTVLTVLKGAALVHDWASQGTQKVTVCIQAGAGASEVALPDAAQDIELTQVVDAVADDPMDDPMFN
jgi:hypothetical protein